MSHEMARRLLQLSGVEDRPVVEVIEIHGVLDSAVVVTTGCREDLFASAVVVDVTSDGSVQLIDSILIE